MQIISPANMKYESSSTACKSHFDSECLKLKLSSGFTANSCQASNGYSKLWILHQGHNHGNGPMADERELYYGWL